MPAQAVQRGPDGLFVYAVKPDQTVEMRPITAGGTASGMTLVENGLTPGEKIILDGQYKAAAGHEGSADRADREDGGRRLMRDKMRDRRFIYIAP